MDLGPPPSGTTRAEVNEDYPLFTTTTVNFQGQEESTTISVPITNDDQFEMTESFQIHLAIPATTCDQYPFLDSVSSETLDIEDDDSRFLRILFPLFPRIPK